MKKSFAIFLVLSLIILGGCFSENKSENKSDLIPAAIAITTDKTTITNNDVDYIKIIPTVIDKDGNKINNVTLKYYCNNTLLSKDTFYNSEVGTYTLSAQYTLKDNTIIQSNIINVSVTKSDYKFKSNWGDGYVITAYYGDSLYLYLPDTVNNSNITSIASNVFKNKKLSSVKLPKYLSTIDSMAFMNCGLYQVQFQDSLQIIGDYAFENNQLTNITLPNSVRIIGGGAFRSNQLTSISLPNSITEINSSSFANNQLADIKLPSSIRAIYDYAFENNQLINIVIPNSVTQIGYRAFYHNKLKSLTIPSSVTQIGEEAFTNLDSTIKPTIYGKTGSYAETYAKENNITFVAK